MAGVTWVSTHPAFRRRGNLRAITRRHFEGLHESRVAAFAGLHPAWVAIYQRYGYGLITERRTYRVDPRDLRFVHPVSSPGAVRELSLETEFAIMVDVYRRYREDRTGLVHRGRAMWDAGPTAPPAPGFERTILVYEDAGTAMGYAVIHSGPSPEQSRASAPLTLRIQDFFALNPEAYRALWSVIGGYDNVREIVWANAPPDDPLPHSVVEPRLLNMSVRDGIMVRIVTVDDALTLRPYPEPAVLRFELRDDFCEWNSNRWRLTTEPDRGLVEAAPGEGPDLTLTPDVLACLVWGRYTASAAAAAGLLAVHDQRALARWDAALRTRHPPHEAEHTW
jgi:predicted acetyltransferase